MLFNSYAFILVFLPVTLFAYHSLRGLQLDRGAIGLLVLASLIFYGWWNPAYLILLVALILVNFAAVRWLISLPMENAGWRKLALAIGVTFNLGALGYFKYANFFVDNLNALFRAGFVLAPIILPLGISFFTFQKIALLVDTYQGKVRSLNFLDFALFVSFFPQLIAGPIVHHSEVMPQFRVREPVTVDTVATAIVIFIIGLCKKVLLADTLAGYATPQFEAAGAGATLTALSAWMGALAYTLQLYFDFSGYSDMAVGAALLFNIRLPLNFASPYKAVNIIAFWRQWHMTLSRFLREYLYIPLGGNRRGQVRRYVNLFITMLLGGLWHGAGWTFVLWGGLHAVYLAINHGWRAVRTRIGGRLVRPSEIGRLAGCVITFFAVVVGWVLFRADDLASAIAMLKAMAGANGIGTAAAGTEVFQAFLLIGGLLALAWFVPNTQELTGYVPPSGEAAVAMPGLRWRPSPGWAIFYGALFASALLSLSKVSEFIYFQF